MKIWKVMALILCLSIFSPGFIDTAEAKKDNMVQEKTAYVTKCSYSSTGSSTGGYEYIELTRINDTEASYKSRFKEWHSSPEKVVEKKVSANILKEMEALGREYKIFKWKVFRKNALFALDAAHINMSVSYKDPTNSAGWKLTIQSDDEMNDKQREYFQKLLDLLYGADAG